MNDTTKKLAKKILNGLEKQKFADWYSANGAFDDYITGAYSDTDPRQPTEEKILEDIVRLFNLE